MKIEAFVIMLSKFGRIESFNFDLGGDKNSDPVDDLNVYISKEISWIEIS